jgi:hypothetical protein
VTVEFDFSEVRALVADFSEAQKNIGGFARKAIEITGRNVKRDWRTSLAGTRAFRRGARSINYDIKGGAAIRGSSITVEVGADVGGAGSLVFIDEFGALSTAPRSSGAKALRANEADFVKGIEQAAADSMKAVDL